MDLGDTFAFIIILLLAMDVILQYLMLKKLGGI